MGADFTKMQQIALSDVAELRRKEEEYGQSWKKRGGPGAFMVLARKWDRIENQLQGQGYDILRAGFEDRTGRGVMDDIGDLRRYLLLVETEVHRMWLEAGPVLSPSQIEAVSFHPTVVVTGGPARICTCWTVKERDQTWLCPTHGEVSLQARYDEGGKLTGWVAVALEKGFEVWASVDGKPPSTP